MTSIITLGELITLSSALPSHSEQGKFAKFARSYSKRQGENDESPDLLFHMHGALLLFRKKGRADCYFFPSLEKEGFL